MARKKWRLYYGFPIREPQSPRGRESSRGIAMMIAVFMTAMMMIFMSDILVNATVDTQLAASGRDRIKAEYMAKSAMNLSRLLIMADLGIDLTTYEFQKTKPTDTNTDIWASFNDIPIGGESLELISAFQEGLDLSAIRDSGELDKLKLFDGFFSTRITDEQARFNVNFCGHRQGTTCQKWLLKLMSCPAELEYLQRKQVNVEELIGYIVDWADINKTPIPATNASTEDDPYFDRQPRLRPKQAYYDTLDELKVIPGWDDDIHQIFSPYLTVYPRPTEDENEGDIFININTVDRALMSCLVPQKDQDCEEKAVLALEQRTGEEAVVPDSSQSIKQFLQSSQCNNEKEVQELFTYRSDVFRIRSVGSVGLQEVVIEAVVERLPQTRLEKDDKFSGTVRYLKWKVN